MNSPYEWLGAWHCPLCNTKRKGFQTTCPCGYDDKITEIKANTYAQICGAYGGNVNNLIKFSDGDGSDFTTEIEYVNIEPTENGYIVYVSEGDGERKRVFSYKDRVEMIHFIQEVLGV